MVKEDKKTKSINREDLVNLVYDQLDGKYSHRQIRAIIKALIQELISLIKDGYHVTLRGLGRIWTEDKEPRDVWDYQQQKIIKIGKRKTVRFKQSLKMRNYLNNYNNTKKNYDNNND